jgi:hypothetical protein
MSERNGYDNLVGGVEARTRPKQTQSQIDRNIRPLTRDVEIRNAVLFNKSCEPCDLSDGCLRSDQVVQGSIGRTLEGVVKNGL